MNHSLHWVMGILAIASIQPIKNSSRASLSPGEQPVASVPGVTTGADALNTPPSSPGYQALAVNSLPGEAAAPTDETPELLSQATEANAVLKADLDDLQARYDALEDERNALLAEIVSLKAPKVAAVKTMPVSYGSCGPNGCGRQGFFRRRR